MNLNPPKLKPLHIGILTVVLVLLIGGPAAYFWIMPMVKANKATETTVLDLEQQASPANETKANKDLAQAQKDAALTRSRWQYQEARYFRIGPNNRVLDLGGDTFKAYNAADQLFMEERSVLPGVLRRWVKSTGNTVVAMPGFTPMLDWPNPNEIDPKLIKLTGTGFKVEGTFPSIMRLLSSTQLCSRLIALDDVVLSSTQSQSQDNSGVTTAPSFMFGNGNTVVATINLTVYIYPRNGDKKPKVDLPGGDNTGGAAGTTTPGTSGLPAGSAGGPPMPGGVPMPGGPSMPRPAGSGAPMG